MDPAPATNANEPTSSGKLQAEALPSTEIDETTQSESTSNPSMHNAAPAPSSKWGRKWALLLVGALLIVYMIIVPTIDYVIASISEPPRSGRVLTDMTFAEKIRLHSVTGVVMLTFLALGGTIGSFLNVVIYRTPRHKPLLWPPSSCASCGTRIQGRDNIPVLGWLLVSGRCRTCHAAISARYPIIEAVIAMVFIALYYIELLSGGENIPVRTPNHYRGIVWILLYTKWDLVGLYLYHCMMLSLVLSVAMMNFDGFRVPGRFAVILFFGFGLLSAVLPALHPVPAPFVPAYLTCLVGFAVGGSLGWCLQWLFPVARDSVNLAQAPLDASKLDSEPKYETTSEPGVFQAELHPTDVNTVVTDEYTMESPTTTLTEPLASAIDAEATNASENPQRPSRYGDRATAPTATTDAAFVMALIGLALGPYAVVSITLLLLPLLLLLILNRSASFSFLAWARTIPITLIIFVVAFSHQLLWAQIHRLLGFGG